MGFPCERTRLARGPGERGTRRRLEVKYLEDDINWDADLSLILPWNFEGLTSGTVDTGLADPVRIADEVITRMMIVRLSEGPWRPSIHCTARPGKTPTRMIESATMPTTLIVMAMMFSRVALTPVAGCWGWGAPRATHYFLLLRGGPIYAPRGNKELTAQRKVAVLADSRIKAELRIARGTCLRRQPRGAASTSWQTEAGPTGAR